MKLKNTTFLNSFIITLLGVVLGGVVLLPHTTSAFFSDTEKATEQTFAASELLFETIPDNQEFYVGPGLATKHTFVVPVAFSASSISNKYDFKVLATTGDATLCAALALESEAGDGGAVGPFNTFASGEYSTSGDIDMTVYYDDTKRDIGHNAHCTADIEVAAWQSNMSKETAGYRDKTEFSVTVIAHMVVLNEVLAKPNTTDTQAPNVEFIELYNNSDFPIDVLGFNITELTAAGLPTNHFIANVTTAPASALLAYDGSLTTIVPAHGYLALKYRGLSSYLNDDGDTITLIDALTNAAIDTYRYMNAITGKSDARIPDGVGAWVDPIPTPNSANIAEDEETTKLVTSVATSSVFTDLLSVEASTSTLEKKITTSSAESTTEAVMPAIVEDTASSSESAVEASEVESVLESKTEDIMAEEVLSPTEPLPLTGANTAAEEALLKPEPVAKTNEDEIEVTENIVVTPNKT